MPELALAPFKRMLRKIKPEMKISDSAKKDLRRLTERYAMNVLRSAVEIAKNAKRNTVMKQDIELAKKQLTKMI